jgi:hypothetical protein
VLNFSMIACCMFNNSLSEGRLCVIARKPRLIILEKKTIYCLMKLSTASIKTHIKIRAHGKDMIIDSDSASLHLPSSCYRLPKSVCVKSHDYLLASYCELSTILVMQG